MFKERMVYMVLYIFTLNPPIIDTDYILEKKGSDYEYKRID